MLSCELAQWGHFVKAAAKIEFFFELLCARKDTSFKGIEQKVMDAVCVSLSFVFPSQTIVLRVGKYLKSQWLHLSYTQHNSLSRKQGKLTKVVGKRNSEEKAKCFEDALA